MANIPLLLEPKFNVNPFLPHAFHLPPLRSPVMNLTYGYNKAFKSNYSSFKLIRYSPKLRSKCLCMSPKPKGENGISGNGGWEDSDSEPVAISSGINEVRSIKSVQNALQIPVITGVLLGLLSMYDHHRGCVALAASGGRMGGRSFSSSSTSSVSSTSTSSSSSSTSPSSSSWSSSPSSSSSRSPSSSSWSSSPSSSSSRSPSSSSWSSSPSSSSSSSSRSPSSSSWSSSPSSSSSSWSSSPSRSSRSSSQTSSSEGDEFSDGSAVGVGSTSAVDSVCGFVIIILAVYMVVACMATSVGDEFFTDSSNFKPVEKTSVVKLQVGLLGTGRSLQTDLNQIAEVADTSCPQGLSYILQETILALLRHPDHCISAYSSVDEKRDILEVEELFNQLSIDERGNFDDETMVNVDNIKKQSATTQTSKDFCNEYIVITIIVAAGGVVKLPPINNCAKLKEALQKLAAIPSTRVKAVEVLWTPQNENDILTENEYFQHYSQLCPI